jgi:hypothetical protein
LFFEATVTVTAYLKVLEDNTTPCMNMLLEDIPHHADVSGKLAISYSVTFGLSVAQHTQTRRLVVAARSQVPASNQTMKSGRESLPSHISNNVVLKNALVLARAILNTVGLR